jgi:hypothetical protein
MLMDDAANLDEQYRLLKAIYFPPPAPDTKNQSKPSNGVKPDAGF